MKEKKYGWKKKLFQKKTRFLFFSTEGGRWRNFSLTFSESTKNLVVIIHRSQLRTIQSQLQHRLSDQCFGTYIISLFCSIRIRYVHEFCQTIHSVPPLCCSAPSTTKVLWIGKLVDFFSHRYVHKSLDSSSNRHLFYRCTTTPGLGSFFSFFSTAADNTLWLV